jgi:hypothetical protein
MMAAMHRTACMMAGGCHAAWRLAPPLRRLAAAAASISWLLLLLLQQAAQGQGLITSFQRDQRGANRER